MVIRLRKIGIYIAILASILWSPAFALADTSVDVNGNGSDSGNTATVAQSTTTQVSSSNNAQVNNTVNSTSNTGNNSLNNNSGGSSSIATGNTTTNTVVNNNLNQTTVSDPSAGRTGNSTVTVSGNGSGSTNNTSVNNTTSTQVNVSNTANVTNTVNINANTGNNSINNTTGSNGTGGDSPSTASIKTGNIEISGSIQNDGINDTAVAVPQASNGTATVTVDQNGAFSTNIVSLENNQSVSIDNMNIADIINDGEVYANTGDNSIDDTTGANTSIDTGDIESDFSIANDVNNDVVIVACGCQTPQPTPGNPSNPSSPSSGSSDGGGSSGGSGGSGGGVGGPGPDPLPAAMAQAILPITGTVIPYMPILLAGFSILGLGLLIQQYGKEYAALFDLELMSTAPSRKYRH